MKKALLLLAASLTIGTASFTESSAQVIKGFYKQSYKSRNNGTFDKGTSLFSVGVGVPYAYAGYKFGLPAIYAKYEMGLMDEVGVGILGGIGIGRNRWNDEGYFNSVVSVLGYYHFNKLIPIKKLGAYVGAGPSIRIHNGNLNRESDINILPNVVVGARYYFSEGFGVYVESGYDGLSSANLGITLRF